MNMEKMISNLPVFGEIAYGTIAYLNREFF
jgi:hypothetical protein